MNSNCPYVVQRKCSLDKCFCKQEKEEDEVFEYYPYNYKGIRIDPYVLEKIYGPMDAPIFQAVKKLLCAGKRGSKDKVQDITEAKVALDRWLELDAER